LILNRFEKAKIIVSIFCISFIQGLQYSVSPVLGLIQEHFTGVNISLVQMLVTAPGFVAMIAAIVTGWLVTKISKKKLLLFAGFIAGASGFMPFLSDSFPLLFFSRTLYGISLGLATALNVAVAADFFQGAERVSVMGIQSASVGTGMFVVSTLSGQLGTFGLQYVHYVNVIGFISMALLAILLPETGKVQVTVKDKITLNKEVFIISFWGFLEFLFLITFTTNIAMHISSELGENSGVSGVLMGIFSGSQIFIGLILGYMVRIFKKYTLPAAMLCFSIGAIIIICFPSHYVLLMVGAVLCGFSQGIFIPRAMIDISNTVKPVATAMGAACFACFMSFGQVVSPFIMNTMSQIIFGSVTTSHVFFIAVCGMALSASMVIIIKARQRNKVGVY
jgi:MFS family permease